MDLKQAFQRGSLRLLTIIDLYLSNFMKICAK